MGLFEAKRMKLGGTFEAMILSNQQEWYITTTFLNQSLSWPSFERAELKNKKC